VGRLSEKRRSGGDERCRVARPAIGIHERAGAGREPMAQGGSVRRKRPVGGAVAFSGAENPDGIGRIPQSGAATMKSAAGNAASPGIGDLAPPAGRQSRVLERIHAGRSASDLVKRLLGTCLP
jgi:hypothetical protein